MNIRSIIISDTDSVVANKKIEYIESGLISTVLYRTATVDSIHQKREVLTKSEEAQRSTYDLVMRWPMMLYDAANAGVA